MGIPRFYRCLSERYPLINENITAEQIPEFDNLYLDMNGIVHNCSHNNTGGLCVAEEGDVFVNVFKYVSRLFYLIRPKKLFYMAVDGCAPRAKMNQQRSRRFRAANEAAEAMQKAEAMGEVVGTHFDSNCITPGTDFMEKLTRHLQFFVQKKIEEDPLWQDVLVVLSGPDEPGEGEHKIMDYIRTAKAQPGYGANSRHCLYGLDADLIMLALASHEPHFALLREEVVFGKRTTTEPEKRLVTNKDRFQLLHVALVREYLDQEFKPAHAAAGAYTHSLERVIDDFVLFCAMAGNDFLPHLPMAEISEGGLDDFFDCYKEHLLATSPGQQPWLSMECGMIAFDQLARFLERYARQEEVRFEAVVDEGMFVLGRRRWLGKSSDDAPSGSAAHEDDEDDEDGANLEPAMDVEEARARYYENKFKMEISTHEGTQMQRELFKAYLEGLQWVMLYYRGPNHTSWSWYYPFYHAPMAADLVGYDRLASPGIRFDIGRPFQPFQQLMAVLPANSKALLPKCYHPLFDGASSPILDFYPSRFEIDIDGVKVPWGGVALIPFIEEGRLLAAMRDAERQGALSAPEARRNEFGQAHSFRHDEKQRTAVETPMPHRFAALVSCRVRPSIFKHPALPPGMAHFINDLLPGFKLHASGFPTLHMHQLRTTFETGMRVFQTDARGKSLMVHLHPSTPVVPRQEELHQLLQAPCVRVQYPLAHHAKVVVIHTAEKKYLQGGKSAPNNSYDHMNAVWYMIQELWKKGVHLEFEAPGDAAAVRRKAKGKGRGASASEGTSDDDLCWSLPVAEVRMVEASYLDINGRWQYKLADHTEYRLVHLIRTESEDGAHSPQRAAAERFREGCRVICIDRSSEAYGQPGKIVAQGTTPEASFELGMTTGDRARLQAEVRSIVEQQRQTLQWHQLGEVAQLVQLELHVLRPILGTFLARTVDNVREDLGMNLMCESKTDWMPLCLPCYSAKSGDTWIFSDLTVAAVKEYRDRFPNIFEALKARKEKQGQWEKDLDIGKAFPDSDDLEYSGKSLIKYVTGCAFKRLRLAPGHYQALHPESILAVRKAVDAIHAEPRGAATKVTVHGHDRLHSIDDYRGPPPSHLWAQQLDEVDIGSRGVYIKTYGKVPCGSWCTVVGVYGQGKGREIELLLDHDSFSGSDLNGRAPDMRGLQIPLEDFLPLSGGDADGGAQSSRSSWVNDHKQGASGSRAKGGKGASASSWSAAPATTAGSEAACPVGKDHRKKSNKQPQSYYDHDAYGQTSPYERSDGGAHGEYGGAGAGHYDEWGAAPWSAYDNGGAAAWSAYDYGGGKGSQQDQGVGRGSSQSNGKGGRGGRGGGKQGSTQPKAQAKAQPGGGQASASASSTVGVDWENVFNNLLSLGPNASPSR